MTAGVAGSAHAMYRGYEAAPRHLGHQIADVDYDGAGDVGRGDPGAGDVEDFEAAGGVLMEEGEDAGVGVGRAAEFD